MVSDIDAGSTEGDLTGRGRLPDAKGDEGCPLVLLSLSALEL